MKSRSVFLLAWAGVGAVLAGCSAPPREVASVNIAEVKQDLETVSAARILLGHQSVGRDILAGVQDLAAQAGVALRIEKINGLPPDAEPGLFHSEIGRNGDPDSKCEVFGQLLNRPERPLYDLAMMKFCYADLGRDPSIEAAGMLDRYSTLVRNLREQRPDVRLVHISLPLKADPPGSKTRLKRLLGWDTSEDAPNALRNTFNEGLRARFSSEPFFDLAALQSTHADGTRSAFSADGRTVYSLAREYTHDGGHLNEQGRRLAAAEFLRTLASALQSPAQQRLTDARAEGSG